MAHSLADDIRERLIIYLAGNLSLLDLQEWLVGATWNVEASGDPAAVNLTYDTKLALAEHSRGDISLDELRRRLRELVGTPISAASPGS
jgi:hypothetical protein